MLTANASAPMNWDDVRVFLAVARNGSLRAAGRALGLSQPTIGRRLAGFEAWPWQGIVAPAKATPEIIAKLRDTYIAAVNDPIVRQKLIEAGLEPLQSTPEELGAYISSETAKWAKVVKEAGITIE